MFNEITGGKFNFIEDTYVRDSLDEAGRKEIVFVGGDTDARIFEIIFTNERSKISFIPVIGCRRVKEYLKKCIEKSIEDIWGVIDRDFKTDEERENEMQNFNNRLYIHSRYTIENYLIENKVLLENLKDREFRIEITESDIENMTRDILKCALCVMAGDWFLLNHGQDFLHKRGGTNIPFDEEKVLQKILAEVKDKLTEQQAKGEYNEILKILKNRPDELSELHKYVNGKYFFPCFNGKLRETYKLHRGDGLSHEAKANLARILVAENLVQEELKEILRFIKVA